MSTGFDTSSQGLYSVNLGVSEGENLLSSGDFRISRKICFFIVITPKTFNHFTKTYINPDNYNNYMNSHILNFLNSVPEECVETTTDFIRATLLLGREQTKDLDEDMIKFINHSDKSTERKIQIEVTRRVHDYVKNKHKRSKEYNSLKNK